ncbi:beta-ketoacyl synthase N-terminal-like domain-containing protein [Streptomyces sp. NPDC052042]|uniref:beta-ketoacyl synthase N-terminal-like domain-containing protein n=1 Tax=Streptomyces sp. NPDC052042 TaxID=3365683 RepID=UPI0037CF50A4
MTRQTVQITGVGLALPGVADAAALVSPVPDGEPVVPADRIGRKGLRYKDRATQLALVAARDALRDARLVPEDGESCAHGTTTAVVASSNLGNLDTVCRISAQIGEESVERISPMDLPNASSNVVASSVAIRFGLRGPNMMLCNGATSGLDALWWGARLIRSGRVARTLVIGVETHNEITHELTGRPSGRQLDGAVALVLESTESAGERGVTPLAGLGAYGRHESVVACVSALLGGDGSTRDTAGDDAPREGGPGLWFTPEGFDEGRAVPGTGTLVRHDLSLGIGRASGALGVAQCAAAVGLLTPGGPEAALLTSGDDSCDAVAGMLVHAAGAR